MHPIITWNNAVLHEINFLLKICNWFLACFNCGVKLLYTNCTHRKWWTQIPVGWFLKSLQKTSSFCFFVCVALKEKNALQCLSSIFSVMQKRYQYWPISGTDQHQLSAVKNISISPKKPYQLSSSLNSFLAKSPDKLRSCQVTRK